MSENEKSVKEEAKFRRSPSFPVIAIDDAIERARRVYRADKRAFTTFETLVGHLGYTSTKKGGRPARAVAALKQYGLLEERNGQYRISDLGWKILEMTEDAPERVQLVKEAALSPPMFRKILKLYDGDLPSDATIRNHLLFQEKFNSDSARDFISVLRRTIELVNPSPEDYNTAEESEGAEQPPTGATPMPQPPPQRPLGTLPPEMQRELLKSSAFGAAHSLLSQPPPATSEGLNFQVSENLINVSFNGPVTQELIRKLIKLLEINVEDFPAKADLVKPPTRAQIEQARGTGSIDYPSLEYDDGMLDT